MTKHDRCRTAYTKAMRALRKAGHLRATIITEKRRSGLYLARNLYGGIWIGKTCCRWRAREHAVKVLIARTKDMYWRHHERGIH